MPLQIANPQNQFSDGSGAWIDFQAKKLVRVNGVRFEFKSEVFAKLRGHVENFTFQNFKMLQGDVKEIAGAARGIKHGHAAKFFMERIHLGAGFFEVARAGLGEGGGADIFPFGAERFNDGRQNQPLDIGARRVVCAKLVAFVRDSRRVPVACRKWRVRHCPNSGGRHFSASPVAGH